MTERRDKEWVLIVGMILIFAFVMVSGTAYAQGKARGPQSESKPLPRLIDIGAKKCIPCKMMAPILEELQRDYSDSVSVEFIDVWENPSAAQPYRIRTIPTQIFYDAAGQELGRHMGFISKEDILKTFKEFGIAVTKNQRKRG